MELHGTLLAIWTVCFISFQVISPLHKMKQPHLNVLDVEDVPLNEQVVPAACQGKIIRIEESLGLLQKTTTKKENVPDLLHVASQALRGNPKVKTRGWNHVLCPPRQMSEKNCLFKLKTQTDGHILVQFFLKEDMCSSVRDGVNCFLCNHSSVRETKFKGGEMVSAGFWCEEWSILLKNYGLDKQLDCSQMTWPLDCLIQKKTILYHLSSHFHCCDHRCC